MIETVTESQSMTAGMTAVLQNAAGHITSVHHVPGIILRLFVTKDFQHPGHQPPRPVPGGVRLYTLQSQ